MDAPLTGVVPVVPTIFHDDQTVDLGGTARDPKAMVRVVAANPPRR